MIWTRRHWIQQASLAAGSTLLPPPAHTQAHHPGMPMPPQPNHGPKTLDATKLASFVDPLPLPELQQPQGRRSSPTHKAVDAPYYRIPIRQIACKLHRDLPPSRLFTYGGTSAPILFEGRSHQGTLIDWVNELPAKHFLPLDAAPMSGMKSMAHAPETRTVAHMHGARVPHDSDGYPDDWFGPGHSRLTYYPNRQDATALWVHDHAMGVSRMNVFAGLMGWYILRDEIEAALNLPSGAYELPLLLYDRSFSPDGQLYYPNPPDEGAWAQEFLGDAMLVNGKVRPFHPVEPRRYRLRIANTSHSRFFALSLSNGAAFHVIGSDQGLLATPVELHRLVIAPAERTDLLVDFAPARGTNVILQSDGLDLLQFRVSNTPVADPTHLPSTLRPISRIPESDAVRTRIMTLNEFDGDNGQPMVMLLNRRHWAEPVTEIVKLGTTEIWSLLNLTEDTHPIHLHMVRFQILDRQSFSTDDYVAGYLTGSDPAPQPHPTGPVLPPAAHELGWKDVVQCPAGTITRIIVPFQGYPGRYLWHCHILEHEANDMMRPFDVIT